jgi:ribulose-bisphosphate carboxylase large chain
MSSEVVAASYRIRADDIEARVEALRLEQTVELPREAIRSEAIERRVLPRVAETRPEGDEFLVTLEFPLETTASDPAQLLNVLFGNSSLQDDLSLVSVGLPASLCQTLGGPRFGIEGLRKLSGVEGRALTCTALKPMGLPADGLAARCAIFARAGIDVIKDDHGLADQRFAPFESRVRACQAAVEGHSALYVPNLTGTPSALRRQLEFARACGVRAVLVAPMLVGLPAFHELVRESEGVAVLAHPALAGAARIEPPALLGTLFRAYGADAVIYPHHGGRFGFASDTCRQIAERLRGASHGLAASMPVPAGGMSVERVPELLAFYGPDTLLLIGGSLYQAGERLLDRSREFADAVAAESG